MGLSIKKHTRFADFCADRIDVITNFAVVTNAVIKRVHCISNLKLILNDTDVKIC